MGDNYAERYSRAAGSANLRAGGDVDSLVAAGWARAGLVTELYRLRAEFDAVRAEWRAVEPARQAAPAPSVTQETLALSERAAALAVLRGLASAKAALRSFLAVQAVAYGIVVSDVELSRAVGRVLDNFLDPLCEHCRGRGAKLVPGTGRCSGAFCGPCGGTGHRRLRFSGAASEAEELLTRAALTALERKMDAVDRRMGKALRPRAYKRS